MAECQMEITEEHSSRDGADGPISSRDGRDCDVGGDDEPIWEYPIIRFALIKCTTKWTAFDVLFIKLLLASSETDRFTII